MQLLTLVLIAFASSSAHAAPTPADPKLDDPGSGPETKIEKAPAEKIETVDITQVKGSDRASDVVGSEYFFPYRKSISPRLGVIYDTEDDAQDRKPLYSVGFQFLYQTKALRSYEAGLDLVSDSAGRAHYARRWFHARTRFRPYGKAGLGVKMIPKDGLATILKLDNWQARGAVGFERLILVPMSLRCELEAALGTEEFELILTAGYSWAW